MFVQAMNYLHVSFTLIIIYIYMRGNEHHAFSRLTYID